MSSQRGNVSRSRRQKYQNSKAFKNDLHDKSPQIKKINGLNHEGLCQRCKEKIEWKIKYKKYKPLTQPSTCVRCRGKTVRKAYYTVCQPCATQAEVCAKCNTKQEIVIAPGPDEKEKMVQDGQLKFELQQLTERKRRAFFRHVEKGGAGMEGALVGVAQDGSDDGDSDICENENTESDDQDSYSCTVKDHHDDNDMHCECKCGTVDGL